MRGSKEEIHFHGDPGRKNLTNRWRKEKKVSTSLLESDRCDRNY